LVRLTVAKGEAGDGFCDQQHGIDKFANTRFTRGEMSNGLLKRTSNKELISRVKIIVTMIAILSGAPSSFATTKGLSQIVTPDLQPIGDLSL